MMKRPEIEINVLRHLYLHEEVGLEGGDLGLIGRSPALERVLQQVELVAATSSTVLISGETGTGKELVARAIHARTERRHGLFVVVNCAALPGTLVESELFGHEKGAFTGAVARRTGRFEQADGGTLFLDEVGELPLETQAKMLRVLQSRILVLWNLLHLSQVLALAFFTPPVTRILRARRREERGRAETMANPEA